MFACFCAKKRAKSVVSQVKAEVQAEKNEEEVSQRESDRGQLELLREKLVEAQERLSPQCH